MTCLARYTVSGVLLHIMQRGNNRQTIFAADGDCAVYLDWLKTVAKSNDPHPQV